MLRIEKSFILNNGYAQYILNIEILLKLFFKFDISEKRNYLREK